MPPPALGPAAATGGGGGALYTGRGPVCGIITRRGTGTTGRRTAAGSSASTAGAAARGAASTGVAACVAATIVADGGGTAAVDACTAGVTGGFAATTGAAVTGRPSVAVGGDPAADTGGFATTGPAGGRDAIAGVGGGTATTPPGRCVPATGGAATMAGARRGCGTIILGAGLASVVTGAAVSVAAAGLAGAALAAAGFGAGATGATGGRSVACAPGAGTTRGGATCVASCCLLSRIARAASPGFDTRDQSIFGFASASWRAAAVLFPPRPFRICVRTRSASSVSIELEWVFFSVTPTAVSASRISLLLTSSSRANSLIRTVLIRPRVDSTSHWSLVLHTRQLLTCGAAISIIISENRCLRGSIPRTRRTKSAPALRSSHPEPCTMDPDYSSTFLPSASSSRTSSTLPSTTASSSPASGFVS
jgi:hypothetical protein